VVWIKQSYNLLLGLLVIWLLNWLKSIPKRFEGREFG
jgi:hypothetical protein